MSDLHTKKLSQTAQDELAILDFWKKNGIFEKSIKEREGQEDFVFYDGPPFATGTPHYGHLLPGTIKDVIPRYQTMKGKRVLRNWGWDCHGLPIENIIEKDLNLNSRKDIIDYGIEKFNNDARNKVLEYKDYWEEIIPRTGRWVDMKNHYKTMDSSYTESIWWAFKELHTKGLVYKGFKAMHLCPRCETTLSNNEVADGYADIKDLSVTAKFKLVDEENTYILAWTTTPWTLPGNVAIAVGPGIAYAKVKAIVEGVQTFYILAKARVESVMKFAGIENYEIVEEFTSEKLVGRSYVPPFDYFINDKSIPNYENGWKVYEADFITDDSGTGIAHEAPAFGAEDLALGKKHNMPFVQHVNKAGEFIDKVTDFAGKEVKMKGDHMATDIEIIKHLAAHGTLFSKEKIEHSYPLCWRCDTPLINYATDSWFIKKDQPFADKMVEENNKVVWVPDHVGHKRFHNWIANPVDWAVSRSRFWGAPLPVWENQTTGENEIIGSLEELKKKTTRNNTFVVVRHAEAESNLAGVNAGEKGGEGDMLTEKGKAQTKDAAKKIQELFVAQGVSGIPDVIVCSPFIRTRMTAELIAESLGIDKATIIEDARICEINFGKHAHDNRDVYANLEGVEEAWTDFSKPLPDGGESMNDIKRRVMSVVEELNQTHEGKNILIVTHMTPMWLMRAGTLGLNQHESRIYRVNHGTVTNAEPKLLPFEQFPHNEDFDLDYHRPFIDKISWKNEKGEEYKLIGEVFDCWFESGAMPFASKHYPFDIKNDNVNFAYPADFISEGIDQTRGWFNTLLHLGVGLFDKAPYKHVVVHGTVLAEDGKKMSKKLKNYPPIEEVMDKYGADPLRYFLLSSPAMRGESTLFSEKSIDDVTKKVVVRLKNVVSFYDIYREDIVHTSDLALESENVLDQWILARFKEVLDKTTKGLDTYEIDMACGSFIEFVDDFSTWYIRRSRDRFKGDDTEDKKYALATTRFVLENFSKVLAPFMPFLAEHIWQDIRGKGDRESVHLTDWPELKTLPTGDVLAQMDLARGLVTQGLDARVKAGIKVRQPLQSVTYPLHVFTADYVEILKDELNVKEVLFKEEVEGVLLDTTITDELMQEGLYRETLRSFQEFRKEQGLEAADSVAATINAPQAIIDALTKFEDEFKRTAGVRQATYIPADTLSFEVTK